MSNKLNLPAWKKVWPQLVSLFKKAGITSCELRGPKCTGQFTAGFAHSLKMKYRTRPEEMWEVALLCTECHSSIENSGKDRMYEIVTQIIAKRTRPLELFKYNENFTIDFDS